MNINTGANVPSKVVFELFDEYCPKTCDNFRKLCEGYQQFDPETKQQGDKIGYAGTEFHRAVKGLYVQGGDLSRITAKSKLGLSIYGGQFADESFHIKHTEPGLIGMCKRGTIPNTNECQFYVTIGAPLAFMDGQNVIFGRVIDGFRTFKLIERMDSVNEKPHPPVLIESAGLFVVPE